jgi:hypothetical protein
MATPLAGQKHTRAARPSTAELFQLDAVADAVARRTSARRAPRAPRKGLFQGHWLDLRTDEKRRATRADLAEAYRLLGKHSDLWEPER